MPNHLYQCLKSIFVLIYTFLYCFLMLFLYLFFRLSLYRSLARKDIRTRNSISAYPQIKKMAHKRALNVWNHENQGKFFVIFNKKIFSFLLWKDFVLNRQNWQKRLKKRRPWTKKKSEHENWLVAADIPNYLTKKRRRILHRKWVKKSEK